MYHRFLSNKLCVQHGDFTKLACLRSKDVASERFCVHLYGLSNTILIFLLVNFKYCSVKDFEPALDPELGLKF
jgi:hypothetical protein